MKTLSKSHEAIDQVNDEGVAWSSLKCGRETALMQLYDLCYGHLYSYGRHICKDIALVEDCIQDTFLEIWERRHDLPEVRFVKAYLLKIVRRKILKSIEIQARGLRDDDSRIGIVDESAEDIIIIDEHRRAVATSLQNALGKLTRRQKEIIALKFFNDLSYDEIVAITGLSQQRIYNLVHEAVRQLRSGL